MPKPTAAAPPDPSEVALTQQSNSSLAAARRNIQYLISPSSSTSHPGSPGSPSIRLRTRLLLRSLHYIGSFLLWRLVRWAKYIAVGTLVAAVSASALGTIATPVGWLAAPPTMAASIVAASVWGVGRFAARRLHDRWVRDGGEVGERVRSDAEEGAIVREDGRVRGLVAGEVGPRAAPW